MTRMDKSSLLVSIAILSFISFSIVANAYMIQDFANSLSQNFSANSNNFVSKAITGYEVASSGYSLQNLFNWITSLFQPQKAVTGQVQQMQDCCCQTEYGSSSCTDVNTCQSIGACVGSCPCGSPSSVTSTPSGCDPNNPANFVCKGNAIYSCGTLIETCPISEGYTCSNGACIQTSTPCTAPNGNNYFVQGTCSDQTGETLTDACSGPPPADTLIKYSCSENYCVSNAISCASACSSHGGGTCQNGACICSGATTTTSTTTTTTTSPVSITTTTSTCKTPTDSQAQNWCLNYCNSPNSYVYCLDCNCQFLSCSSIGGSGTVSCSKYFTSSTSSSSISPCYCHTPSGCNQMSESVCSKANGYCGDPCTSSSTSSSVSPPSPGGISGTVTDSSGKAISGAIINAGSANSVSATTDPSGHYQLTNLNSGTYSVSAWAPNYLEVVMGGEKVESNENIVINFNLASQTSVSNQVQITYSTGSTQKLSLLVGNSIQNKIQVSDDPNGFMAETTSSGIARLITFNWNEDTFLGATVTSVVIK